MSGPAQVGYPTPQRSGPPAQISPESLTGVIAQTRDHLNEVEARLHQLIMRVSPYSMDKKIDASIAQAEDPGMMASANYMRNTANRVISLVAQLDSVL